MGEMYMDNSIICLSVSNNSQADYMHWSTSISKAMAITTAASLVAEYESLRHTHIP